MIPPEVLTTIYWFAVGVPIGVVIYGVLFVLGPAVRRKRARLVRPHSPVAHLRFWGGHPAAPETGSGLPAGARLDPSNILTPWEEGD